MKNKFYISTAIPYVNADPHIGFTMELIQADVIARYQRLMGDAVFFMTGTDENALKNVQAAERTNVPVREFIDKHAQKFIDLTKVINLSNDDFIRTTEERHIRGAQKLWQACMGRGDIYKKSYKGLYCIGCEEFKTEKDLVDEKCPEHGIKPEIVEEENYFFRLSKYEKDLLRLIESGELTIIPEAKRNETLQFIKQGLKDFSISRSKTRAKNWGIPVPGDDEQIQYVWFDALTCYVNALGYADDTQKFQDYWQNGYVTHLFGKGVNRFHTIYWPAMLTSAGLVLPRKVFVHGYVNIDGEKISKSLGNTIDPFNVIEKYGAEVVRYFLLREIPSGDDGDFSYKKLGERYNGDLANGLGNLVQRVATLIENSLDGELIYDKDKITNDELITQAKYQDSIEEFRLHDALGEIWKLISKANQYVDDRKPWVETKENPSNFLETMTNLIDSMHDIAWLLQPFMPETADKIAKIFGDDLSNKEIPENYKFKVKKEEGLFPRLK
ncbi:MAG: methionine--tRNA ligase [Candidatus Yanofskybacteria bacterium RIFCSPLOWO2_01_FULL_41_34]|uniref:Methionine--tRNA ligase n=1 Tax=Candidatus Yanofskybacteria bacterium RIFCSPHIGHO2_01_FULL_41_26 TaxID=1802661 RepID=A0A1F8EGH3_9BACT|nr:MAG: methionine--tRNA ligase [Candidatus Yanofskybacteria bacterium RIFCSPHIGHO2_01_FULL_41_26]OGN21230.1 MAG: methionine--tRNA ligase [Candidatus Yanofskybacteria bacterium RIFCSPLOWO2_01_FULL_41_34]